MRKHGTTTPSIGSRTNGADVGGLKESCHKASAGKHIRAGQRFCLSKSLKERIQTYGRFMPRVSQTSSPLPRWKSTGSELLASFGRFIVFGGEELLEVVLATVLKFTDQ
jgi:hypothetical protein